MENNFGGGFDYSNQGFSFDRWDSFSLDDEARARRKFSKFFLALTVMGALATLLSNAIAIIIHLIIGDSSALLSDGAFVISLSSACMYLVAFPVLLLMVRKMRYVPRRRTGFSVRDFFFYLSISTAVMYVGSYLGVIVSEFFGIILGGTSENRLDAVISDTPLLLVLFLVVIVGPIIEELVFRKLLMDKLGAYGDRIAIFVSAIAFALYHGNLYQLFYAFGVGLILAFVYSRHGSVIYTIIIHAVMNFIGSLWPLLLKDHIAILEEILPTLDTTQSPEAIMEYAQSIMLVGMYSLTITALTFIGFFMLFRHRRNFFVSDRCEVFIPRERRAKTIIGNLGAILFLTYCGVTIIFELITPLITGGGA